MAERHHTGGTKEFVYKKEDLEKIRSTDTSSTKNFKESYRNWQAQKEQDRLLDKEMKKQRLVLLLLASFLILMAIILVVFF